MSFFTRFARQWIAGETLESAIARAKKANASGLGAIINYLGEHVKDKEEANKNIEENLRILAALEETRIRASLSIKITQLGLLFSKDFCLSSVDRVASRAAGGNIFVWIDMEDSSCTEDTINIYLEVLKKYRNVGIAIQSNLKRSESDVRRITASGGMIRLVKGAYKEKSEIAFTSRSDITINFSKLMGYLFYRSPFFAIATHDDRLIEEAITANKIHKKRIEFQTLMGVRDELKNDLVRRGFNVVDYIPYGAEWFPYSLRRIRERKRNIILLLRSVFDI